MRVSRERINEIILLGNNSGHCRKIRKGRRAKEEERMKERERMGKIGSGRRKVEAEGDGQKSDGIEEGR
jgi:hypothetical protein